MTDAEFISAIQDNEANYFATFDFLGEHVEVERTDDATLLFTGVPFWLFNGVFRPRITEATADTQLDKWIRHFKSKNVPFGVFLYPPEKTPAVEQILKGKGFKSSDDTHLTVFDTDKIKDYELKPMSSEYSVLDIRNEKQFEGFADCWAEAFKVPSSFRKVLVDWANGYGFDSTLPSQNIAITHGDRTVAIASYYLDRKIAGLYNIAVDADYRRQGLGVQITIEIARRAHKSGVRYLAGTGSVEGMRVYRKFGIHEVGVCRRWYYE